ncbi:MAG: SGNH/GDSL hydrolase family protein [Candidatus Dormibacteraceae bacterium]
MADRLLEVYFCGGSHLGTQGLSPTQVFPVLVSRGLRRAWGAVSSRSVHASGKPQDLPLELGAKLSGAPFLLVVLPRNMFAVPLPMYVRMAVPRFGGRPMAAPETFLRRPTRRGEVRRRLIGLARLAIGLGLCVGLLPGLPRKASRYGRAMDAAIAYARGRGCRCVIWATPIPLDQRRFPGSLPYQAAIAGTIRRRAGRDVVVVDLYHRFKKIQRESQLSQDPLHLTAAGHRIVAEEVLAAILERTPPAATGSRPGAPSQDGEAQP